jgi:hypothetical protein
MLLPLFRVMVCSRCVLRAGGLFGPRFNSIGRGDELLFKSGRLLSPDELRGPRYLTYADDGPARTNSGWLSQVVGGGTVHSGGASFRILSELRAMTVK